MKIYINIILIFLFLASGCEQQNVITRWKNGDIPYYLDGEFSKQEKTIIREAMRRWESVCGVKFEEVLPRSNAYMITKTSKSNTWASSIGENNVQNRMYFGTGTNPIGHVLHELGHCIGLIHEHQRPDRDTYVEINFDNIRREYWHNFEMKNNPLIREESYPYDFNSIMHYHSMGFSKNGEETIFIRDEYSSLEIHRVDDITEYDAMKCRRIYGPPKGSTVANQ